MAAFSTALTAGHTADGLRAWKQNASGVQTYFVFDGSASVSELNSIASVTAFNTFGAEGQVSRYTTSSSVFYTFDPQGNVVQTLE